MKNVFVYGTLQPGGSLYEYWIAPAVVGEPQKGTITGTLYHVTDDAPYYPVAKLRAWDTDGERIAGTVLPCDENHSDFVETVQMEKNAGYTVLTVPCTLEDGTVVEVEAFHYIGNPRGAKIEDGNWFAELERLR